MTLAARFVSFADLALPRRFAIPDPKHPGVLGVVALHGLRGRGHERKPRTAAICARLGGERVTHADDAEQQRQLNGVPPTSHCAATLAISMIDAAGPLLPEREPFAPWDGPAALAWSPHACGENAAALPPPGAQFAPRGGPAALT